MVLYICAKSGKIGSVVFASIKNKQTYLQRRPNLYNYIYQLFIINDTIYIPVCFKYSMIRYMFGADRANDSGVTSKSAPRADF